jgi:hypothetical protein
VIETGRAQAERTVNLLTAAGFSATVETDDEVGGTAVLGRT